MSSPAGLDGTERDLGRIPTSATRTDQVIEVLREAIAHGTLDTDELFSVQMLANQLGVSRTPVREALLQLAREGIVQFERNRGVRVVHTSAAEMMQIFEIRLLLEVPATRKAVKVSGPELGELLRHGYDAMIRYANDGNERGLWQRDRAFHRALLAAAGNPRLASYVDSLRQLVLRGGITTAYRSRSLVDIATEHLPVLEAVLAGDAVAAGREMQRHLTHTADLLEHQLSLP